MINRIVLTGRLVADPEIRYTQNGIPVVNFCIAVERNFKNANGERETDFINIVAWRKQAELINEYCRKGYMVGIDGSLQMRRYQTSEGETRRVYEVQSDSVQFLDRGGKGGSTGDSSAPPPNDYDAPPPSTDYPSGNNSGEDPDLPF